MIRKVDHENGITTESFDSAYLAVSRALPFSFALNEASGVSSPNIYYMTDDNSKQGAFDLITYIKILALTNSEPWKNSQLSRMQGVKTIFIVYENYKNIYLDFSTDILVDLDVSNLYKDSNKNFISYEINKIGLEKLVNELLIWMG